MQCKDCLLGNFAERSQSSRFIVKGRDQLHFFGISLYHFLYVMLLQLCLISGLPRDF